MELEFKLTERGIYHDLRYDDDDNITEAEAEKAVIDYLGGNDFLWDLRWRIEAYCAKDDLDNRSKKELTEFICCLYNSIVEHLNEN